MNMESENIKCFKRDFKNLLEKYNCEISTETWQPFYFEFYNQNNEKINYFKYITSFFDSECFKESVEVDNFSVTKHKDSIIYELNYLEYLRNSKVFNFLKLLKIIK